MWDALVDLRRFGEWNPFIRRAWGSLHVGNRIRVRVQPGLGIPLFFRATVLARHAHRAIRWRGHFLASWLASGDHTFTLEPGSDGRVHFEQREVFRGVLPRLAPGLLERETRRGFDAMNGALKERAESARSARMRGSRVPS